MSLIEQTYGGLRMGQDIHKCLAIPKKGPDGKEMISPKHVSNIPLKPEEVDFLKTATLEQLEELLITLTFPWPRFNRYKVKRLVSPEQMLWFIKQIRSIVLPTYEEKSEREKLKSQMQDRYGFYEWQLQQIVGLEYLAHKGADISIISSIPGDTPDDKKNFNNQMGKRRIARSLISAYLRNTTLNVSPTFHKCLGLAVMVKTEELRPDGRRPIVMVEDEENNIRPMKYLFSENVEFHSPYPEEYARFQPLTPLPPNIRHDNPANVVYESGAYQIALKMGMVAIEKRPIWSFFNGNGLKLL